MGWLSDMLRVDDSGRTFEQELELLIARWTNQTRKGREALTIKQVAAALMRKAEQIVRDEQPRRG